MSSIIKLTRELKFSKDKLFDLVADIEKYPEFIPWVDNLKIIDGSIEESNCLAKIYIGYKLISKDFSTFVEFDKKNYKINVILKEGPFKHLNQNWHFEDSSDGTIINFAIDFALSSKFLEKLIKSKEEYICNIFINSFIKRAENLYGNN